MPASFVVVFSFLHMVMCMRLSIYCVYIHYVIMYLMLSVCAELPLLFWRARVLVPHTA